MRLDEAVDLYLADLEDRQCAHSTIQSARGRLARFLAGHESHPLEEITGREVGEHFQALAASGLAHGTLAGYKSTHKAFWRWATSQNFVPDNPARILSRREFSFSFKPINHQPADREDLQHVIDYLASFVAHRGYHRRDVRDGLLVSLTVDSSARRGSLWQLRRADMVKALQRGEPIGERVVYRALVSGKTGATPIRFFNESADLARLWLNIMPAGAVWLFCSLRSGKRIPRDYMGSAFKRICEYAGVPTFSFQAVRKRVVMDVIQYSGDTKVGQLLAGHADRRTTDVYYNLVQEEVVAAAAANLSGRRREGDALAAALFGGECPV